VQANIEAMVTASILGVKQRWFLCVGMCDPFLFIFVCF
jgi:hypothetical protein